MTVGIDIETGQKKQAKGVFHQIKEKYNLLSEYEKKSLRNLGINICIFIFLFIALGGVAWGHVERQKVVGFYGPVTGITDPNSITTHKYICNVGVEKSLCRDIKIRVNYTVGERKCACSQTIKFNLDNNNEYDLILNYLNTSQSVNIFYGIDNCNRCFNRFDSDFAHVDDIGIVFLIIFYIPLGIGVLVTGYFIILLLSDLFH
tara:strand:- start:2553 stop:3161 length:609 start_codon:yes stop_codon:yes gene_type:complete